MLDMSPLDARKPFETGQCAFPGKLVYSLTRCLEPRYKVFKGECIPEYSYILFWRGVGTSPETVHVKIVKIV